MTYLIDFTTEPALSLAPATETDAVIQNLYCLFSTTLAEVPCYREFGIDKEFLHMPVPIAQSMAIAAISEALDNFFPELEIEDIEFSMDGDASDRMITRIEVSDSE